MPFSPSLSTASSSLANLTSKKEQSLSLVSATNPLVYNQQNKPVKILDEDSFIDKLEKIIEKDFFPDLEKHKIQQAYYDAVKANDFNKIKDLHSKYTNIIAKNNNSSLSTPKYFDGGSTPSFIQAKKTTNSNETPYANEEPPVGLNESELNIKKAESSSNMSLDKFLSQNTSEDNVSFDILINESKKEERKKVHQSWLFEKEQLHQIKYETSLMLENGGKSINDDVTKSLDTWTYKSKNTLMYIPEGSPLTGDEELAKSKTVRVINHANTRFKPEVLKNTSTVSNTPGSQLKNNPHINAIPKIGVDGKEADAHETPKVKGYGFVDPSPSPMPGRSLGDESPMMVWGEIESTPFRLDNELTPGFGRGRGPEFKIPDVPEREKLALDLEEKASAARRKKKNEALQHVQRNIATQSPKNSPSIHNKINSMSPAAQKLLSCKLNLKTGDKLISSPFTSPNASTPSPSLFSKSSPYFMSPSQKTSISSNQSMDNLRSKLKRPSDSSNSLTDNLLKLPKNS